MKINGVEYKPEPNYSDFCFECAGYKNLDICTSLPECYDGEIVWVEQPKEDEK